MKKWRIKVFFSAIVLFVFAFSLPVFVQAFQNLENPSPCGTGDDPVEVATPFFISTTPLIGADHYELATNFPGVVPSDQPSIKITSIPSGVHWWVMSAFDASNTLIGGSITCYISVAGGGITCSPGAICIENPLNTGSLTEIIDEVINFIFRAALVVAPLMIIYGGFLFVTGGGNPEQISRGKRVLMWTVIGLIVIILSKGLIALLQTALGVNGS